MTVAVVEFLTNASSLIVTVIVALPSPTAVTVGTPWTILTVATDSSLDSALISKPSGVVVG